MNLDIQTQSGWVVVAPSGDVDLTNAADLRTALLAPVSNDSAGVILDLTRTRYLDSAGMRVLFSVARRLEERRRRLVIVAPQGGSVTRLLSIVDIESRADVHETLEAAAESLHRH